MPMQQTNKQRQMAMGRKATSSRTGHKPYDGNHNTTGSRAGMSAPKGRAKGMNSGKSGRSEARGTTH